MMKISQKNWKFKILQRFSVFSTVYWILLKFSDCKLTQIPREESKKVDKIEEGKNGKILSTKTKGIDYESLWVIPVYTSLWKNLYIFFFEIQFSI